VARKLGVKVLTYSLGFGPTLWSTRKGPDAIEYRIAAFPLGGYVKMLDEREAPVDPSEQHRAFNSQPVWKRFLIVLAGPVANILLALVLWMMMFMVGVQGVLPKVGVVPADSVLARSGLQDGDLITQVGGQAIHSLSDLRLAVLEGGVAGAKVPIEFEHQGAVNTGTLDLTKLKPLQGNHQGPARDVLREIGYRLWSPKGDALIHKVMAASPAEQAGLKKGDIIEEINGSTYRDPWALITRIEHSPGKPVTLTVLRDGRTEQITVTPKTETSTNVDGKTTSVGRIGAQLGLVPDAVARAKADGIQMLVVAIAEYAGQSLVIGFSTFLGFMALVSLSLAIMNLLPIPLLDGGHLVLYVVEALRGKPAEAALEAVATKIGLAFLVSLMALAFYNDISRLLH
ncbi:MAG: RIP metalloprotease RseP, partial [Halothiobacillus sp. 13-55-253]